MKIERQFPACFFPAIPLASIQSTPCFRGGGIRSIAGWQVATSGQIMVTFHLDFRPPSPVSSPQGEDITLRISGFAKTPAPIQSQIDDETWGTFLLLPGEKAGMRAGVQPIVH
jgi:hypothetical protein